jgi:exodeoxyribonuclease-3
VRAATWNVNSVRARLERVLAWLEATTPSILLLQETKAHDEQFPRDAFEQAGYHSVTWGTGQWNGVAVLSAAPIEAVRYGVHFEATPPSDEEPRVIAAAVGGVWWVSAYAPNGRALDDPHYAYKLAWFRELRGGLERLRDREVLLGGDLNVAPSDLDVWDPAFLEGMTHVSEPERAAFRELVQWGLVDLFRELHPDVPGFTWWDYRQGAFRLDHGLRIDFLLASGQLAARARSVVVDRDARRAPKPSDHAPLVVDFDDERS